MSRRVYWLAVWLITGAISASVLLLLAGMHG